MNNHSHWKVTAHENFKLHRTQLSFASIASFSNPQSHILGRAPACPICPDSERFCNYMAVIGQLSIVGLSKALFCRLRPLADLTPVLWSLSFCLTYRSGILQSFDGSKEQGLERSKSNHVTLDDLTLKNMAQDCSSVKEQLLQLKTLLQVRYKQSSAYWPGMHTSFSVCFSWKHLEILFVHYTAL